MLQTLFDFFAKPFAGLTLLVQLFGGIEQDNDKPSIARLNLFQTADSVFVQASLNNGLTPKIKELMEGGVVVQTTCTFLCGTFTKQWKRELQYNPVKRSGCYLLPDGVADNIFKEESLSYHFNTINIYLTGRDFLEKMQAMPAKLTITSIIKIEVMEIGEKELWPNKVMADFVIPELLPEK
jgi:hypothetical protein